MRFKQAIAGTLAAAALTVGTGSAAFATTASSSTPTTPAAPNQSNATAGCHLADQRVALLEAERTVTGLRVDFLQQDLAWAKAHNKTALAQKLQKRIDRSQKRAAGLTSRIQKLQDRCHVPAATSSGASSTASPTTA